MFPLAAPPSWRFTCEAVITSARTRLATPPPRFGTSPARARGEWEAGEPDPSKYDIRAFLPALAAGERPLHAHSTEEIAYDLKEAIGTSRSNRRAGMNVRAPWREKRYRPPSFTAGYGWRVHDGALHLSLGRGRPRLAPRLPEGADPTTGAAIPWTRWGEIKLCWDIDARKWSLHIAV